MKIRKLLQIIFKKIFQVLFLIIYGKIVIDIYKKKNVKKIIIKKAEDKHFLKKKYHTYQINEGRIYTDYVENVAIINDNCLFKKTSFQQRNGKLLNQRFNSVLKIGTPRIKKNLKVRC